MTLSNINLKHFSIDFNRSEYLYYRLKEFAEILVHYEVRESFSAEIEVEAVSTDELTSPQVNTNILIQVYHT